MPNVAAVSIGSRQVGPGQPCFVIAEAGVNHNGDSVLAHRLVDVAADAGADAVKFQTFSADRLASETAPKARYQRIMTDGAESQHAMLARLELRPEWHAALQAHARARGIAFLSSPFDDQSVDFLDELGVAAFKVPSGEITNHPYLERMAGKGRPIILSSGMSYLAEVVAAVETVRAAGNDRIVLLHCLSNYPADPAETNLRAMATLAEVCGCPIGFSDHTEGHAVSIAAVALGACVIERHFTLDRTMPGPDHTASLEPEALAAMIRDIRATQAALGDGVKRPQPSEVENRAVIRKSIVAARDLRAGHVLRGEDLEYLRPGTGLSPQHAKDLIGARIAVDLSAGQPLALDMVEGG